MANRELLELAAKAAGMLVLKDGCWPQENVGWFYNRVGDNPPVLYNRARVHMSDVAWAPLTNDADALRLAVKLRFSIYHNHSADNDLWVAVCDENHKTLTVEDLDGEVGRTAATRRAIVRAAAEIGKSMP